MTALIRCLGCDRHVRNNEAKCPFCAFETAGEAREVVAAGVAPGTSRAKRYAARAAVIAGAAALVGACAGKKDAPKDANQDVTANGAGEGEGEQGQGGEFKQPPPTPYGCVWPDEDDTVTV